MAGELCFVIALVAAVCLGSQASLDRYGKFAAGKEGFQERCFVRHILMNEIIRYANEPVAGELKNDLAQVESSLGPEEYKQFGTCYEFPICLKLNHEAYYPQDFGSSKLDGPEKVAHDEKVSQEALERVRAEQAEGVAKFKACWAQKELEAARRAVECEVQFAGDQEERTPKQKRKCFLRRMLHF